jgi:hypothetical protein
MNASNTSTLLKLSIVAMAFALPNVTNAAGTDNGVTTRTDTKLEQHNGRDSVFALSPDPVYAGAQVEPQRYGRAGGYVGTDKVEMSRSMPTADSARVPAPQAAQAAQPAQEGRTAGGRFDNPDSAHGQEEGGIQTR